VLAAQLLLSPAGLHDVWLHVRVLVEIVVFLPMLSALAGKPNQSITRSATC
jgi:hypothetical protein